VNAVTDQKQIEAQAGSLIDEIIKMSDFSFERLPMLDIIGERLADYLSVTLPDLTGVICEATLSQLDYLPMAQAIDGFPSPVLLGVATTRSLDGGVLLVMDAPLVLTTLELALGGSAKEAASTASGFTAIESGFGGRLTSVILSELSQAFSVIGDVHLEHDRIETDAESAAITQPASLCVRMQLAVSMAGRIGQLQVILPYDALEPIRARLGKIHYGERSEDGNPWRDLLAAQIENATVKLEAVFAEIELPIQEIMAWKPGDTVPLWIEEAHETTLYCAETPMYRAATGKRNNGNTAIRITELLEPVEETENGRDSN
jgi:flagellar motor switch protein FliM